MDRIITLHKINRWWVTGKVDSPFLYKVVRDEFRDITALLEDKRIISLIGPRRIGKSTLMYQTINYLLDANTNPKNILLFSGDDPGLFSNHETVYDILNDYTKEVLHQDFETLRDRVYIFIDEIHFIKDWQLYLKSLYDRRYNIKFIISGSSSIHLFEGSRESMMGRLDDIYILPLSIGQFTRFYTAYKEDLGLDAFCVLQPTDSVFANPEEYYKELNQNKYKLAGFESAMNKITKTYLLCGGYPEYFDTDNLMIWRKRLTEDIISRGLYRDIVSIYKIKNPEILERLLFYIAANSGSEFSYSSIAQTLGVDSLTISSYMNYLSQAFFVSVCNNYSPNVGKVIRKNKKIYISDSGVLNGILRNYEPSPESEGVQVENCTVQMARNYSESEGFTVYFWRSNQQEADIIIDKKFGLTPVEVKYRNTVLEKDLKGLFSFIKTYEAKTGLVITKNYLQKKEGVIYIPFWMIHK
ncbi:MAG: ATP-binding protein [Synergistaceae bacterium]|nr:ATP-binding protein [Synergistaceae bacterium]